MHISVRDGHTFGFFIRRTLSAQIHLLGVIAAIVGLIPLVANAGRVGGRYDVAACLVFGLSAILVFSVSSVFHFLHDGFQISRELENFFENLDHASIYIFIAGTYTPFLLNTVAQPWRGYLLIGMWSLVSLGVCFTIFRSRLPKWMQSRAVYTSVFVALGWTLVVRVGEIFNHLSSKQIWFLFSGAMAYSIGAVVYATKRPRLFIESFGYHELWHSFVVAGFTLHYLLIFSFYQS